MIELSTIYGCADKLTRYVKELESSQPTLYNSSKLKLASVAAQCAEISNILVNLVGVESVDAAVLQSQAMSIQLQLTSITNQLNYIANQLPITTVQSKSHSVVNTYTCDNPVGSVDTCTGNNLDTNSISENNKSAIAIYGDVLHYMAESSFEYYEASRCAQILNTWFQCRFNKYTDNFKYNIKRIPKWIRAIVAVYSKHLADGTRTSFEDEFSNWCNGLKTSKCQYAIPYEVFKVDHGTASEYATLTCAVMWDILSDMGMNKLYNRTPAKLYLSECDMYEWVKAIDINILDNYNSYKYDKNVLKKSKIVK